MSDHPDRSRRDRVAAAATVAAVLVLGVSFAVLRADRDPGSGSSGPAPSARTELERCGAGDLAAGPDSMRLTAGTVYLTATLQLAAGVEPCSVGGYPTVIVLSDGRPAGVATATDAGLGRPEDLTVLPERPARVTLGWPVLHHCGPTVNDGIRLWVAPDLAVEVAGFGPTSCRPGDGRPPVRVGAYSYVDPTAEEGTLTGVVTLNSGPGPGTGEFVTAGVVEVDGGPGAFTAPVAADGSYELDVPAGRYRVTVSTHQWMGGTPYSAGPYEVAAGELHRLNLTLPLR